MTQKVPEEAAYDGYNHLHQDQVGVTRVERDGNLEILLGTMTIEDLIPDSNMKIEILIRDHHISVVYMYLATIQP